VFRFALQIFFSENILRSGQVFSKLRSRTAQRSMVCGYKPGLNVQTNCKNNFSK